MVNFVGLYVTFSIIMSNEHLQYHFSTYNTDQKLPLLKHAQLECDNFNKFV